MAAGYVLTVKKSRKDKDGAWKSVELRCDRGGNYTPTHTVRQCGTRIIGCPFEVVGSRRLGGWFLRVKNNNHNHDPSGNLSGHPKACRLAPDDAQYVREMTDAGASARNVITGLTARNPDIIMRPKTIYNERLHHRVERMQALFDVLRSTNYVLEYVVDDENRLKCLFWAHPTAVQLTRRYHSVFLLDCTYKTNQFRLPLLNIVGVAPTNDTFFSCFCLLSGETLDDYSWALHTFRRLLNANPLPEVMVTGREMALINSIEQTFPAVKHILCKWHLEKDILAKCRSNFADDDQWKLFIQQWNALVFSGDEAEFSEQWRTIGTAFATVPGMLNYIDTTWMPFKERFAMPWTKDHFNMGHTVTSRIESAHALLKTHLKSTSNLSQLREEFDRAIEARHAEIFPQWRQRRFACHSATESPFSKSWCIASLRLPCVCSTSGTCWLWVQLGSRWLPAPAFLPPHLRCLASMSCWTICSAIVRWNSRKSIISLEHQSPSGGGVATGRAARGARGARGARCYRPSAISRTASRRRDS